MAITSRTVNGSDRVMRCSRTAQEPGGGGDDDPPGGGSDDPPGERDTDPGSGSDGSRNGGTNPASSGGNLPKTGADWALTALAGLVLLGLDADGADFVATVGERAVPVRLAWSRRLTERPQVRQEVVRVYHEACDVLGIEPRPGG